MNDALAGFPPGYLRGCQAAAASPLREHISKAVAPRVTQEHTLDLVGMPLNALEPRVRAVLGWKH